jgi:Uma2 family endonuclease
MDQVVPRPIRPPSSNELVIGPGEPMETERHLRQMLLLIDSLEFAWRDRTDFFVGGSLFLYFSETQSKRNDFRGPDVMVVLDTTKRERRAWVVWEEDGKTPNVIIELLSETTEHVDRGEKMRVYARLKVAEYFLFDPLTGVFEGYELDALRGAYARKQPDALGHLRCAQMDLSLGKVVSSYHGIQAPWLRWIFPSGAVIPLAVEQADAETERADAEAERADAEAERANAEAERANAEAERARALTEELATLKSRG